MQFSWNFFVDQSSWCNGHNSVFCIMPHKNVYFGANSKTAKPKTIFIFLFYLCLLIRGFLNNQNSWHAIPIENDGNRHTKYRIIVANRRRFAFWTIFALNGERRQSHNDQVANSMKLTKIGYIFFFFRIVCDFVHPLPFSFRLRSIDCSIS